jgi:3',5'-cyclic AMP phosphodiesterase CpdA
MVIGTAEVVVLDVGDEKSRVGDTSGRRIPATGFDESVGTIDADRLALRAHESRDPDRAVAEAATDIEHAVARPVEAARQELVAVPGEARDQEVLEALELVEQHRVPGFDDDVVLVLGQHDASCVHCGPASSGGLTVRKVQRRSRS